jgi:hypothetical protein
MAVFNTSTEHKLRIDNGGNSFVNGKCTNPLSSDSNSIDQETKNLVMWFNDAVKEKVEIVGHVPSFTYGFGDDEVTVNTGHKAW